MKYVHVIQVKSLNIEMKSLPASSQLAAAFMTYLPSAPEDVRKNMMQHCMDLSRVKGDWDCTFLAMLLVC